MEMKFVGVDANIASPEAPRVFRLVTGEMIISTVKPAEDGDYVLIDPIMVEIVKGPQGPGVRAGALIPLGSPGDSVTINKIQIQFWIDKPAQVLLDKYSEMISPIDSVGGIIK